MKKKHSIYPLLPILSGFFVMGFCDVVGISSNYIKQDFQLSDTLTSFLPFALFIWFFIFSIPTGILMNKIGRKKTVQVSNVITIIAMLIPFAHYSYLSCLLAFALLGIANTILQVSLNPLLSNVVHSQKLTSALTAGQFIKAISSFSGPFIAAFAVRYFHNWQAMFPIFSGITVISFLWLQISRIEETQVNTSNTSFRETMQLLGNKTILLLFCGIVCVVGIDVGINMSTPRLLMERCALSSEEANYGVSVYFFCRTAGAFIGAILLSKYNSIGLFRAGTVLTIFALSALFFVSDKIIILIIVGVVGLACANIFPILFSFALNKEPEKANEISGLMITGVAGGALIPVIMGVLVDRIGSQTGSIIVIFLCAVYLLGCSLFNRKNQ